MNYMFQITPRMSREERLDQIFSILQHQPTAITLKVLSKIAGIGVSPYLRGIVDELARDGMIEKTYHERPGSYLPVCLYKIAPKYKAKNGG